MARVRSARARASIAASRRRSRSAIRAAWPCRSLCGHRLEQGEGLIGGLGPFERLAARRTGRHEILLDRGATGIQCGPGALDLAARFGLGQRHQFLQGLHQRDRQAEVEVRFYKRAHNPLLLAAGFADIHIPIPWLDNSSSFLSPRLAMLELPFHMRGLHSLIGFR